MSITEPENLSFLKEIENTELDLDRNQIVQILRTLELHLTSISINFKSIGTTLSEIKISIEHFNTFNSVDNVVTVSTKGIVVPEEPDAEKN